MWTVKSLRYTLWSDEPNFGRTVSALLAGIVWMDVVALQNEGRDGAPFEQESNEANEEKSKITDGKIIGRTWPVRPPKT